MYEITTWVQGGKREFVIAFENRIDAIDLFELYFTHMQQLGHDVFVSTMDGYGAVLVNGRLHHFEVD